MQSLYERCEEHAELHSHPMEYHDGSAAVREMPTLYDSVLSGLSDSGHLATHEKVGEAAREVVRTCEEYDVPIEPRDVTVVGVKHSAAPLSCSAYGTTMRKLPFQHWTVDEEPDGYVIFVEEENELTNHSWAEAVRHEIAHICGLAEDGETFEQCMNHAEWCDRLDTW